MPTNNFIESSFWNFDSLFQPQQHPARDQHDTFFLSDPALAHEFPQDYLQRVKRVHSEGGFGSQGSDTVSCSRGLRCLFYVFNFTGVPTIAGRSTETY
uniref:phenylalanine--tRNA ligase alpha subunit-like n=1 Tax=Monopterus albus TaxID=43700 RepID=UPI0009B38D55|nr:phenylalanine--tRNA ligase alpha subunit-like [Monopterus albus]